MPGRGTILSYGESTLVILSAVDSPPGPSVVAMHGPGGTDRGGTIGCVTVPTAQKEKDMTRKNKAVGGNFLLHLLTTGSYVPD